MFLSFFIAAQCRKMSNFNERGEIINRRQYPSPPPESSTNGGGSSGKGCLRVLVICVVVAVGAFVVSRLASNPAPPAPASQNYYVVATDPPVTTAPNWVSEGPDSTTPDPPLIVGPSADEVVREFFYTKVNVLRTLDSSAYSQVLTGSALEKRVQAVDTLRNKNCYWDIVDARIDSLRVESIDWYHARVVASVQEDARLYCNGNLDHGSYNKEYRMANDLQLIDGRWYIYDQQTLD